MIRRRFSSGESEFNPDKYLTIEALEDGLQVSHAHVFEYKTYNSEWQRVPQYELTTEINKGEFLYIRANWTKSGQTPFKITRSCNLRGNCLSLLFGNNADKQHNISQYPNAFSYLFNRCPIKEVASGFLPATTLAESCYEAMFFGCTNLINAPELPATTLASYCYHSMFSGCTNLNYIKMLATDISALYCMRGWVGGVASTGTFVKNPAMTTLPTATISNNYTGIPSGWTVVNDGEEIGGNLITFTIDGTEYQAEEGMRWSEWVNSKYNTAGYYEQFYSVYDGEVSGLGLTNNKTHFVASIPNIISLVSPYAFITADYDYVMLNISIY